MRNLCRWFRRGGEISRQSRASSERPRGRAGWFALCFRRRARTNLPHRLSRRALAPACKCDRHAQSATAPAGEIAQAAAKPPEGTHPDAGSRRPFPQEQRRRWLRSANAIYRGQVGGAACTGCHGAAGHGSPLGPDLTGKKWLWSDGSYAGIKKTITEGVSQPKNYRSPMPAMGGAQLTADQVSAVAAYVWSIGQIKDSDSEVTRRYPQNSQFRAKKFQGMPIIRSGVMATTIPG